MRTTWVEPIRVTAEVVPMPARFGPLVATMIEAGTLSAFGSGSLAAGQIPSSSTAPPAPAPTTIAVSATPVRDAAPGSDPAPGPWLPAPSPDNRFDPLPLLQPTGSEGVVQSYLIAAAGSVAGSLASGSSLAGARAGAPASSRAMIRLHDGHSGRSVVMASREGVGDGRLVITVVFN